MALELNTDIAVELNITARKGDTFEMKLAVVDSANTNLPYDLSGIQNGAPLDTTNGYVTTYQGKMTIKKLNSEFEALNVYSYFWKDNPTINKIPTLIKTGNWSGESSLADGVLALGSSQSSYAGIWFKSSIGNPGDVISVSVPGAYMNLDAGVYVYDFQTRKKSIYDSANSELGTSYTTWMYGTFTIVDEITKQ
tara:strand:+ start:415 stop:996 length:582 start_codon:yes stop_codon:yes gene_type:complete